MLFGTYQDAVVSEAGYAHQDVMFIQYMFNGLALNPAYTCITQSAQSFLLLVNISEALKIARYLI